MEPQASACEIFAFFLPYLEAQPKGCGYILLAVSRELASGNLYPKGNGF
jgi:hypothetical protein